MSCLMIMIKAKVVLHNNMKTKPPASKDKINYLKSTHEIHRSNHLKQSP